VLAGLLFLTLMLTVVGTAEAQWSRDPGDALLLPDIPNGYFVTSDSLGGVFILGAEWDYSQSYCNYINGNGFPGWNEWISIMPGQDMVIPYGVFVSPEPGTVVAMLATEQRTNGDTTWDFRAQKMNIEGERMWPDSGVSVTTRERNLEGLIEFGVIGAVSDGEGGLIVLWNVLYYRMITEVDRGLERQSIRAQRLTSDGESLWGNTGIEVVPIEDRQAASGGRTVSDGSGGVIMIYYKGSIESYYIGGQRISSDGENLWGDSGVLYRLDSYLRIGEAVSDYHGGVVFSGQAASGANRQVRVFRFNRAGEQMWGDGNGLIVKDVHYRQGSYLNYNYVEQASDSVFFFHWKGDGEEEPRSLIQAVDLSGNLKWDWPGVTVCDADTNGHTLRGVSGVNSVIYGWTGYRPSDEREAAFYCQRLDEQGNRMWADEGVLLFDRRGLSISKAVTDCYGGAIFQIGGRYLQHVNRDGELGVPLSIRSFEQPLVPGIIECTLFPNPTNGLTTLTFPSSMITNRQFTLFDLQGRLIFEGLIPSGVSSQPLDVSAISSGSYILQIRSGAFDAHRILNIIK